MVERLKRPLPQNVLDAKAFAKKTGNTELLSELGRRGALVANKRRALRKIQAERQKQAAANDLFSDEALAAAHDAQVLADAEQHAEENRIGWCDE